MRRGTAVVARIEQSAHGRPPGSEIFRKKHLRARLDRQAAFTLGRLLAIVPVVDDDGRYLFDRRAGRHHLHLLMDVEQKIHRTAQFDGRPARLRFLLLWQLRRRRRRSRHPVLLLFQHFAQVFLFLGRHFTQPQSADSTTRLKRDNNGRRYLFFFFFPFCSPSWERESNAIEGDPKR